MFFVLILLTISSFKVFDLILVMTDGGPGQSTLVLSQFIYRKGFEESQFGYASAISVVLFVIVLLVTVAAVPPRRAEGPLMSVVEARHRHGVPGPAGRSRRPGRSATPCGPRSCTLLITVIALGVLVPFVWMVSSSLKINNEVFTVPIAVDPRDFQWHNYVDIWSESR